MGTRGPAADPVALTLIKGNARKLPVHALTEALRPTVHIPDCPDHLNDEAKLEWARITPELKKLHIISNIDLAALAVYCQAYGRWVMVERQLKDLGDDALVDQTPSGYRQISVLLQISNRAVEQMHRFLCEFGMSPSSRARISANVCVAGQNSDLFEDLENQGGAVEPAVKPHGPGRFFNS